MKKLKTGGALCAATLLAFAASYASGRTPPAPSDPQAVAAAAGETAFADRQGRILRFIRMGRMEGWLDRTEARSAYRALRGLRLHEDELRAASAGRLTARQVEQLDQGYDDLAQALRWKRARGSQDRYRPH